MPFNTGVGEQLSRFIVERSKIRPSDNTVKFNAFIPPTNGRLSVYWTTNLPAVEIWAIADQHVGPALGKHVIARAEINSLDVYAENLAVDLTGVPHPRHADIIGWDVASTATRLQAIKLASKAQLRMR